MTDRPMGDGWWLASDGRWYPPESRPAPPPPPAPPPGYGYPDIQRPLPSGAEQQPRLRFLSFGLTGTVAAFLWSTAAVYTVTALSLLVYRFAWSAHVDRPSARTLSDLDAVEDAVVAAIGLGWLVTVVTGILFLIWFFQAYESAASRGAAGRTWGSGWTVGAWFIPLGNLVIPKLVMNEIDRMSNPRVQAPVGARWRGMGRHPLNDLWWACLVMAVIVHSIAVSVLDAYELTQYGYGSGILIAMVASVLVAAAAALAGALVLLIGRRRREGPPISDLPG